MRRSVAQHGIQLVYRPVQTLGEADTEAFRDSSREGVETELFSPQEIRKRLRL